MCPPLPSCLPFQAKAGGGGGVCRGEMPFFSSSLFSQARHREEAGERKEGKGEKAGVLRARQKSSFFTAFRQNAQSAQKEA